MTLHQASAPIRDIAFKCDISIGSTTPPEWTGAWVKSHELDQKSSLERALLEALGAWQPRGWTRTVFVMDESRAIYGRSRGSRDPIPFPYVTITFNGDEVVRLALAIRNERVTVS